MTNDMTVGNPTKLVIKFIIPLLIGNIVQQFYSMVDTIIVGKFVGTNALAGVGSTGSINFLILGFIIGLTGGFSIPISQRFGACDYSKLRHYVAISGYLCIIFSIVMTISSIFLLDPLLKIMRTPSDIYVYAKNYMFIMLLGTFTSIAYNMTASILRAIGDSHTPLYFLIIASILNIVLDLIFIINFNMGVSGAAIATILSQGLASLLCGIYMFKKFKILKFEKNECRYDKSSAKYLTSIGLPMGFQFSIVATGSILLQAAVNSLGTVYVASYAVSCKIEQLGIQPFVTLGTAAATFVGQNLGAGKFNRIADGMKKIIIIGFITAIITAIFIIVFQNNLISLFLNEGADRILVEQYSKEYLIWSCASFIPLMLLIVYRGATQAMGDMKTSIISGISELVGRVFVANGLVGIIGYLAICLACPAAWSLAAICGYVGYRKKILSLTKTNNN